MPATDPKNNTDSPIEVTMEVVLEIHGTVIQVSIKNSNAESLNVYPSDTVNSEEAYIAFAKELSRILGLSVRATRSVPHYSETVEEFNV